MLRFTIRDALWLTVVVGLACGWWSHYESLTAIEKETHESMIVQSSEHAHTVAQSQSLRAHLIRQVDALEDENNELRDEIRTLQSGPSGVR